MIEFAITAVPVLLVGLGGTELARWFYMKQALSLALLEAARAGITQHARPQAIKEAFDVALRPLYPSSRLRTAAERVRQALDKRHRVIGQAPWRIRVTDPTAGAFTDFADPSLSAGLHTTQRIINNNYQKEQHTARLAAGWVGGMGPTSGLTIYEANTLTLELTYPVKPLVPGLRPLLRLLGSGSGYYAQRLLAGGYLPVTQEIHLTMQSHPMEWPDLPDGTVVHGEPAALSGVPPVGFDTPCHGIWCLDATPSGHAAGPVAPPNPSTVANPEGLPGGPNGSSGGATDALATPPGDPACGLTLCCIG
ncbi:MAG TPA: TadE family protein [Nevskiaceae bacterium]|nr:TadE family protein [Nevskiaceae bacterium]